MVLSISKRSRARLQRVPDLARVVERAIQITTEDLRVQKGLRRVSGVADPFGGIKIPASRTSAFRKLDPDHLEEHEQPFAFAAGRRRAVTPSRRRCGRLPDVVRGEHLASAGTTPYLLERQPARDVLA
jgi:hypothetical protein